MAARREYETLVERGIMPSTAAAIIRQAEPTSPIITPADIERARSGWYFSPAVPEAMRRILDARQRP